MLVLLYILSEEAEWTDMMHTHWDPAHQAATPDWTAKAVACLAGAVVWLPDRPPSSEASLHMTCSTFDIQSQKCVELGIRS